MEKQLEDQSTSQLKEEIFESKLTSLKKEQSSILTQLKIKHAKKSAELSGGDSPKYRSILKRPSTLRRLLSPKGNRANNRQGESSSAPPSPLRRSKSKRKVHFECKEISPPKIPKLDEKSKEITLIPRNSMIVPAIITSSSLLFPKEPPQEEDLNSRADLLLTAKLNTLNLDQDQ